jgi:dipeptidyl aminopeptidase/acylaminoacyl peptidase
LAEQRGHFRVDDVSPVAAAAQIAAPVFLLHGAADRETTPDHSRRVFEALRSTKRLVLVEGARHSQSLRGDVWTTVDRWLDEVLDSPKHL